MFNFTPIKDETKHTAAHILAAAVLKTFPKAKIGIGPVTKSGFYYDFEINKEITEKEIEKIEKEIEKIRIQNLPMQQLIMSRDEALNMILQRGQIYKAEILKTVEDEEISFYKVGDFIDLCRGPHVKTTGEVGPIKIVKVEDSHWNDDDKRPKLKRIHGISFASEEEVNEYARLKIEEVQRKYSKIIEESNLGKKIDDSTILFENGSLIYSKIEKLISKYLFKSRDNLIYTNNIDNIEELSEHIDTAFESRVRSPREFPLILKAFAKVEDDFLNQRNESNPTILAKEYSTELDLMNYIEKFENALELFKILEIETRVEIFFRNENDQFVENLSNIFQKKGISHTKIISEYSEDVRFKFYGYDLLNRSWPLLEISMKTNILKKNYASPINILNHRVNTFRVLAFILENTKGILPKILSPNEIVIIPVKKAHSEYAIQVAQMINEIGYIAIPDLTSKSINKKVYLANKRNSTLQIIVGDKEHNTNSVSIRHQNNDLGLVSLDELKISLQKITD